MRSWRFWEQKMWWSAFLPSNLSYSGAGSSWMHRWPSEGALPYTEGKSLPILGFFFLCVCLSVSLFEAAPTSTWMKCHILATSIFLKETKLHPTPYGRWTTSRLITVCIAWTYVSKLFLDKLLKNWDFFLPQTYLWFFGKVTELHNRLKNFIKTYKIPNKVRFLVVLWCFPPSPTYS